MPAVTRNRALDLFWRVHSVLYRVSGGRLLGSLGGVPLLVLTTGGRKSGESRTKPLRDLVHGDAFVVAASFAGKPRHPAWSLNLLADPRAQVQVGSIVAQDGSFAEYDAGRPAAFRWSS